MSGESQQQVGFPFQKPLASYTVIGLCVAMFVWQMNQWENTLMRFALWPLGDWFQPWQIASHAFMHGNITHLLFNMLGLHMFGADVERVIGTRRFLWLYGISVLFAAIAQLLVGLNAAEAYPTVGASGGLFGLMLMYAVIFPKRTIVPLIPPIPMPAWLFVLLYAGAELYFGVTGTLQSIAHFAHLGGLVGGVLCWQWWRWSANRNRR